MCELFMPFKSSHCNESCDALLCSRNIIFCRAPRITCTARLTTGKLGNALRWRRPAPYPGARNSRVRFWSTAFRVPPRPPGGAPALHYQTNLEQPPGIPSMKALVAVTITSRQSWSQLTIRHPTRPKTIVRICRQGFMSNLN